MHKASRPTLPAQPETILFVCTANICRSVLAEKILKALLAAAGLAIDVRSAGIDAAKESKASPEIVRMLQREGIDLENHGPQPVTPEKIAGADIIFVMEYAHRQRILALAPEASGKIFFLSDFYSGTAKFQVDRGIPDPAGMSEFFCENVGEIIRLCCEGVLKELIASFGMDGGTHCKKVALS